MIETTKDELEEMITDAKEIAYLIKRFGDNYTLRFGKERECIARIITDTNVTQAYHTFNDVAESNKTQLMRIAKGKVK
jgi:hypothetical protein